MKLCCLNWVSTHLHHCQGFWRLGLELDDWIVTMAWEVCSLLCWLPASFRHCKGCLSTISGTAGSSSRTLERRVKDNGFKVSPPRELPLSARTVTRRKPSSPSAAKQADALKIQRLQWLALCHRVWPRLSKVEVLAGDMIWICEMTGS